MMATPSISLTLTLILTLTLRFLVLDLGRQVELDMLHIHSADLVLHRERHLLRHRLSRWSLTLENCKVTAQWSLR